VEVDERGLGHGESSLALPPADARPPADELDAVPLLPHREAVNRHEIVFRTLGANLWLAAIALLFGLVALASATRGGARAIVFGACAAVSFVVVVRALRASVVVTDQGVVVRGFSRTHRLRWDEIATVSGKLGGEGRCVRFALADGRTIPARGCSSYSIAKLERIARAIADLRPRPSEAA